MCNRVRGFTVSKIRILFLCVPAAQNLVFCSSNIFEGKSSSNNDVIFTPSFERPRSLFSTQARKQNRHIQEHTCLLQVWRTLKDILEKVWLVAKVSEDHMSSSSTLKLKAVYSSETLVPISNFIRSHTSLYHNSHHNVSCNLYDKVYWCKVKVPNKSPP